MANLKTQDKAQIRSDFYELIDESLGDSATLDVVGSEPISTGLLVELTNGAFVEIRVIVKDENKFDIAAVRAEYQEKLQAAAERAAKHAENEAKKAAKAAEKAAKAVEATPAE